MNKPCSLCRPSRPCPWHEPEAIEERNNYWTDHDANERREDHNGLIISMARYVNHARDINAGKEG